jgi:hypothetical protein
MNNKNTDETFLRDPINGDIILGKNISYSNSDNLKINSSLDLQNNNSNWINSSLKSVFFAASNIPLAGSWVVKASEMITQLKYQQSNSETIVNTTNDNSIINNNNNNNITHAIINPLSSSNSNSNSNLMNSLSPTSESGSLIDENSIQMSLLPPHLIQILRKIDELQEEVSHVAAQRDTALYVHLYIYITI